MFYLFRSFYQGQFKKATKKKSINYVKPDITHLTVLLFYYALFNTRNLQITSKSKMNGISDVKPGMMCLKMCFFTFIPLLGLTPMHLAAQCGSLESLNCLLALRADYKLVDKRGWMAIHFAAFYGQVACIHALCRKDPALLEMKTTAEYVIFFSNAFRCLCIYFNVYTQPFKS